MINLRTPREIDLLRRSGQILAATKRHLRTLIKPGVSTYDLDHAAELFIKANGGLPAFKGYNGFPATLCTSINAEMIHGIPRRDRILRDGDLLKIDLGVIYEKYYTDSAFTISVGHSSPENDALINAARDAFYAATKAVRRGARLGDVSAAIGRAIKERGFVTALHYAGHGVGTALHEEPLVENEGTPGTGPLLKDGMVLAIEPMVMQRSGLTSVASDNWTVIAKNGLKTAHYEETIAIINGKLEILTEETHG